MSAVTSVLSLSLSSIVSSSFSNFSFLGLRCFSYFYVILIGPSVFILSSFGFSNVLDNWGLNFIKKNYIVRAVELFKLGQNLLISICVGGFLISVIVKIINIVFVCMDEGDEEKIFLKWIFRERGKKWEDNFWK